MFFFKNENSRGYHKGYWIPAKQTGLILNHSSELSSVHTLYHVIRMDGQTVISKNLKKYSQVGFIVYNENIFQFPRNLDSFNSYNSPVLNLRK